jgi:hypothetical protein
MVGSVCMFLLSGGGLTEKKSQSHLILIRQLINVQERDKLHEQSAPANRVEQSSLNGSTFNSKATNTH